VTRSAVGEVVPARLWTSTMRRTIETAQFIKHDTILAEGEDGEEQAWVQMRPRRWFHLDEIFAGDCCCFGRAAVVGYAADHPLLATPPTRVTAMVTTMVTCCRELRRDDLRGDAGAGTRGVQVARDGQAGLSLPPV
jgi:hypothetical protein